MSPRSVDVPTATSPLAWIVRFEIVFPSPSNLPPKVGTGEAREGAGSRSVYWGRQREIFCRPIHRRYARHIVDEMVDFAVDDQPGLGR